MYRTFVTFACAVFTLHLEASNSYAEEIMMQVKSYIAPLNLSDSSQWDPDAKSCQTVMAAIVSCGTKFGEDPADGTRQTGNFRLLSQLKIDANCDGRKVSDWTIRPVETDFGKEFYFISTSGDLGKPLNANPSATGKMPVDKVTLSYRVRGQPNAAGTALMSLVKARTCRYIWHEVSAILTCKGSKLDVAASLTGSAFPSHKLWVQGSVAKHLTQGPFRSLWKCDPSDPTSVQ
jgi:hypothetical protein